MGSSFYLDSVYTLTLDLHAKQQVAVKLKYVQLLMWL